MESTEQFIADWLIAHSTDPNSYRPYVYQESSGGFTLDGEFNIKELALALDKRDLQGPDTIPAPFGYPKRF